MKNQIVVFASYDQLDDILKIYESKNIYTIEKPPRKISRRLYNSPFIEMITLPPYLSTLIHITNPSPLSDSNMLSNQHILQQDISTASNIKDSIHDNDLSNIALISMREEILFTLGYFTSLASTDLVQLPLILANKVIITSKKNSIYGAHTILVYVLAKLGCRVCYYSESNLLTSEWNDAVIDDDSDDSHSQNEGYINTLDKLNQYISNLSFQDYATWADECTANVINRLRLLFPLVNEEDNLTSTLDKTGISKFKFDNVALINRINSGHYIPSIFKEKEENTILSTSERLGRVLLSRQAVTSQFVSAVIDIYENNIPLCTSNVYKHNKLADKTINTYDKSANLSTTQRYSTSHKTTCSKAGTQKAAASRKNNIKKANKPSEVK